ncbi:MAG: hypothetical protein K2P94_01565 [Rhodospirillaceae bacterium]|nr:hypothetical protein [Rhodospirillaceae bacterium]
MRRIGYWSALSLFSIGVAYVIVLGIGMAAAGLTEPILDPILAVMEVLTLLSALVSLILVAAVHARTAPDYKIYSLLALVFMTLMAGATISVHFVELTALRQMGSAGLAWPSIPYAIELLAWDVFLGLSLIFAAVVFRGNRLEASIRTGLLCAGSLCIAGTTGPVLGDMRFQFVAIAGYAVVLPIVSLLIAMLFRQMHRRA